MYSNMFPLSSYSDSYSKDNYLFNIVNGVMMAREAFARIHEKEFRKVLQNQIAELMANFSFSHSEWDNVGASIFHIDCGELQHSHVEIFWIKQDGTMSRCVFLIYEQDPRHGDYKYRIGSGKIREAYHEAAVGEAEIRLRTAQDFAFAAKRIQD